MRPPKGGKAPERQVPQAIACRLHRLLSPRFDDPCVEESYLHFAGRGSEAVQRFFALAISVCAAALWAYHLVSPSGLDRQARAGVLLTSAALLVAWFVWVIFRCAPVTMVVRHRSALHACQSTVLVGILCWGLPLTARPTCSTLYSAYDANLQQAVLACLLHAGVVCRMSPGAFLLLCVLTSAMLLASQTAWAAWSGQEFSAGFELCKLLLLLAMLCLSVRRSDEARRREFATRAPQRHGHAAAPQAARSAAPASARAAAALRDREVGALGPPLARPVVPMAVGQRSRGVRGVIMRGVITRGLMRGKSDVARPLVDPPPTGHAARPPPSPTPSSTLAPSAPPSPPSPALTPSPPSPLAPPSPPQPPPSPSLPPKASSSAPSLPGAPPRTLPPVSLANGALAAGAVASGEVLGAALRTLTLTPTLTLTLNPNPNPNPNLNPNPNPNPNQMRGAALSLGEISNGLRPAAFGLGPAPNPNPDPDPNPNPSPSPSPNPEPTPDSKMDPNPGPYPNEGGYGAPSTFAPIGACGGKGVDLYPLNGGEPERRGDNQRPERRRRETSARSSRRSRRDLERARCSRDRDRDEIEIDARSSEASGSDEALTLPLTLTLTPTPSPHPHPHPHPHPTARGPEVAARSGQHGGAAREVAAVVGG